MRRRHPQTGFTIVELLVVISVIVLLLSMLLPALSAAREQSRRAACAINLKQNFTAIFAYATDRKGLAPVTHGSDPYMQCKFYNSDGSGATGLGYMVDEAYTQTTVMRCPSRQDVLINRINAVAFLQGNSYFVSNPNLNKAGLKFDYDYRYNLNTQTYLGDPYEYGNWGDTASLQKNSVRIFEEVARTKLLLMSDCSEFGSPNDGSPTYLKYNGTYAIWAHTTGGNILTHDGAVRFCNNTAAPFTWGTTNRLAWPSDWIINQCQVYQFAYDPMTSKW